MTLAERKTQLLKLKEDLNDLREMSEDARAPVILDQQSVGRLSRMDALQGQAMAEATERQRQADLVRIENALRRIETGDYGFCLECEEEIPEKRLDIDPAAALCVRCAG
ncbi:TraR/DksA family transcriptional regulator [Roseibium sediminis]|uniref:TraR/DksA family transcriptional regulator n=1 Tax=Roseibium sediminis TaxID=1775174 RepID=UPI00123DDD9A|nr:TraR/DksA C4-type zinc finger protein [Roseibium sediminis]